MESCEQNMKSLEAYRTYAWATYGICFNFLVKNVQLCGQGKLRSTVHEPYRMENRQQAPCLSGVSPYKIIQFLSLHLFVHFLSPVVNYLRRVTSFEFSPYMVI